MTLQADQLLSARVRRGTRAEHQAAQGSGFLDRLADGSLPRAAYADLATQHYAIYETLEKAAAGMAVDPTAGAFVFPELTRLPALTADLAFLSDSGLGGSGLSDSRLGGSGLGGLGLSGLALGDSGLGGSGLGGSGERVGLGSREDVVLPATVAYCDRLREVAFERAPAFVAHHYTRYLGDLSGGQYLGPAIARAYGLDGDGHRFFVFEGVDPGAFRVRYRELLDQVEWTPAEQEEFLAEVAEAYKVNIAVLAELKEKWA